jgi:hypothetical protein
MEKMVYVPQKKYKYFNDTSGSPEIFPTTRNEDIRINAMTIRFAKILPLRIKLEIPMARIANVRSEASNELDTL